MTLSIILGLVIVGLLITIVLLTVRNVRLRLQLAATSKYLAPRAGVSPETRLVQARNFLKRMGV